MLNLSFGKLLNLSWMQVPNIESYEDRSKAFSKDCDSYRDLVQHCPSMG